MFWSSHFCLLHDSTQSFVLKEKLFDFWFKIPKIAGFWTSLIQSVYKRTIHTLFRWTKVNSALAHWLFTHKKKFGLIVLVRAPSLTWLYLPLNDLGTLGTLSDSSFVTSQDPVSSPVLFSTASSLSHLLWAFLSSSWNILSRHSFKVKSIKCLDD